MSAAIRASNLRPPNLAILFGRASRDPAEESSSACLRVELALRPAGGIGIESARPTHSPRVLVERACPPRGEFLFRLDASEAATSRAVVTVVDPSVRSSSGGIDRGCVLARVELPVTDRPATATRLDPPLAPAHVVCPQSTYYTPRIFTVPDSVWVDRAEELLVAPPRALSLTRVASLLLFLDVCVLALFILFKSRPRGDRRAVAYSPTRAAEMPNARAIDADVSMETHVRSESIVTASTLDLALSSSSSSSFEEERGTTRGAGADDPPSPSFAAPERWNVVTDIDAPADIHEPNDWCISAVVRGDLTHAGAEETDLVTAFLAAPPRGCGRDVDFDPDPHDDDPFDPFSDDEEVVVSLSDDDEEGITCRERTLHAAAGSTPAANITKLAAGRKSRRSRRQSPFTLRMWGRSMPGHTSRALLRDLSKCAQFAGATLRLFAPGSSAANGGGIPEPRLPLSVAAAQPETAGSFDRPVPRLPTVGSAAGATKRARGGWTAAVAQFAAAAAPPATAPSGCDKGDDATALFRKGWEGSRRDSKGRLAKK